jgi:glycine/serine hydroxymethyltransferase
MSSRAQRSASQYHVNINSTQTTMSSPQGAIVLMNTQIREYRDADYEACRSLWAELTEHHRLIYGDPSIGGNDPCAGIDEYLAT